MGSGSRAPGLRPRWRWDGGARLSGCGDAHCGGGQVRGTGTPCQGRCVWRARDEVKFSIRAKTEYSARNDVQKAGWSPVSFSNGSILVCALWLRLCGPDREGSFKLGPFKKGFRGTHTVSGLLGYP